MFVDAWINSFLNNQELIILFRIALAVALGFVLGIERELYKRPAGLRTHVLVCMASCLIMLVSMYGFEGGDPARLAAQVVSGIGFLGAGAILRSEKDIKGITTAATIWMSAMLGLACGNGFYFGAILVTIFSLIILTIFRSFETKMAASSKYKSKVYMVLKDEEQLILNIKNYLQECNLTVSDIDTKKVSFEKKSAMKIVITFDRDSNLNSLYDFIDRVEKNHGSLEVKLSHE